MFSDSHRTLKFIIALILACSLAALYAVQSRSRDLSMPKACADPAAYNGRTITRQMCKITSVEGCTLTFVERKKFYTAIILPGVLTAPIKAKERVSLSGTFRDCVLYVERYHLHSFRKAKILISLLVLLLLTGWTWYKRATWLPLIRKHHSSK